MLALLVLLVAGGAASAVDVRCPWACACVGDNVDCAHRGLTQVPRNLPSEAQRV